MEPYHTPESIPIGKAIGHGLVWVYGPFPFLFFGLPLVLVWGVIELGERIEISENVNIGLFIACFVVGFVSAWLWWSYSVPKWRLWAYERVENIPELIAKAIAIGLVWPPGHFFEKTEIKSKEHAAKEKEWEAKKS